jgi:hypothetical protein
MMKAAETKKLGPKQQIPFLLKKQKKGRGISPEIRPMTGQKSNHPAMRV